MGDSEKPLGGGGAGGIGLEEPAPGPPRPEGRFQAPVKKATQTIDATYWFLKDAGVPGFLAWIPASLAGAGVFVGGELFAVVLTFLAPFIAAFVVATMQVIQEIRREGVPQLNEMTTETVNELMGTNFKPDELPIGPHPEDVLKRAQVMGARILETLEAEFVTDGKLSPEQGREAAHAFTGFVANFAVASSFTAMIIEMGSGGQIEDGRELGVQLAENLGLGRMARRGISELVGTTVATPYEWFMNKKYRPALLSPSQAVRAFLAGLADEASLHEELARQGFSDERMRTLVDQARARLTDSDLDILVRYGAWTRGQAVGYLRAQGFTVEDAEAKLAVNDLQRVDGLVRDHIAVLKQQRVDGVLDTEQFRDALAELPITEREALTIRRTTEGKLELPRRFVTLAQMQSAFEQGIVDLDELNDYLIREGYSPDDQTILRLITLLRTAAAEEAAKQAAERAAARAAKKKAATPATPGAAGGSPAPPLGG